MEKPFSAYKGTEPFVFICYAHRDSDIVYEDMKLLKQRGVNIWYDEGIAAGSSWRAEIATAISGAHRFLFFISDASLESAHCMREVHFALDQEIEMVPIYLQNCKLPDELALVFGGVQAIFRDTDTLYLEHLGEAAKGKSNPVSKLFKRNRSRPGTSFFVLGAIVLSIAIWFALSTINLDSGENANFATQPHAFAPYMEGLQLLERWDKDGNLDAAISKFRESLSVDPEFALALARLAEALRIQSALSGEEQILDAAFEAANKAASLNSELTPVQVALGRVYLSMGNIGLAHAALQHALEIDSNDASVHIGLGRIYQKMGRLDDAENAYRKAIALDSKKPNYFDQYANFLAEYERHDEAIAEWQSAISLAPDYYPAFVNLGATLEEVGRIPEAAAMYELATAIRPTYMGYVNLGTAYSRSNRLEDAVKAYKQALEIDDSDWLAWGNLGYVYSWMEDMDSEAEKAFNTAIELANSAREMNPRDAFIYSDLALYQAKLGQTDNAKQSVDTAMTLSPDSAYILSAAAECYETLGQRDRALELLADAIDKGFPEHRIMRNPELSELLSVLNH